MMEQTLITKYDLTLGNITTTCTAIFMLEDEVCEPNEGWVPGFVDGSIHYIDPVTQTPTPLKQFADDITITDNTITGIPTGSKVIVFHETYDITDGLLEIDVLVPRTVTVILTHPIYAPATVGVSCV